MPVVDAPPLYYFFLQISSAVELTLSGNQARVELQRFKWQAEEEEVGSQALPEGRVFGVTGGAGFNVTIAPMEIKTFEIEYTPASME
jgi:hypothetical protein